MANDSLMFVKKIQEYHLNGEHVQATDGSRQWAAPVPHAPPSEQMLKGARNISDHLSDFLLKECVDRMRKFIIYNIPSIPAAPVVTVFPPQKKSRFCFLLTCMATGFYPRDIRMSLRRNRITVPDEDGVTSTGTRPNGDGTFQMRKSLEILECQVPYDVLYECVVEHTSTVTLQIIKLGNCLKYYVFPFFSSVCLVLI